MYVETSIEQARKATRGNKIGFVEREVGIVIHRQRGRPTKEMQEFMTRTKMTTDYLTGLSKFIALLKKERKASEVFIETGRRFDKININGDLAFFVEKESGTIYGVRSPVAPNFKHYYGTLDTAPLWKWENDVPEPKDERKAGVEKTREYAGYMHYRPVEK